MRVTSLALLGSAVALSGCGGSTAAPATTRTQPQQGLLRYSQCMRANGVPNFPDPSPSGGFQFSAGSGIDPSSPAMRAAQAKCRKLMLGGALGPTGNTHPTSQWLAHMEKVAMCMRRHGVPGFPDPRTSVPSNPFPGGGTGVISDIDGAVFVFPSTLDTQTPAFVRAAKACGFPLHNH